MKKLIALRRSGIAMAAAMLLVGATIPSLLAFSTVSANQITSRSIQISDSTPAATGVSYKLTFTSGPTAAQELIVDFCGDSAIIGATCAFSAATVPNVASATSSAGTLATVGTGVPVHTIKVTGLTIAASTAYTITFSGIANPTGTNSFYARVLTYATGNAAGYAPASTTGAATTTGTYVDYGGDALSTATNVSVTATVMETLSFCVSAAAPGAGCTSTTAPTLTLGSGSPLTLGTPVSTAGAYTQLSTNALSGAVVSLKTTSSTACSGLSRDGGATCPIAAIGAFAALAAGSGNFGLNVANGTGGTGTVTANPNYGTTAGSYGMGTTAPISTYGDPIESSTAPVANVNSALTYAAAAATTTPAGVYKTTQALIATGTF